MKFFLTMTFIAFMIPDWSAAEQINFPHDLDRQWENNAFRAGERLIFNIDYSFITAGQTEMKIDTVLDYQGFPCYRLTSQVKSNKTFDFIFKVRDRVETYIDAKGIFSRRYYKQLNEGTYNDEKEVVFFQEEGKVDIWKKGKFKKSAPLLPCSQDILSALYFIRTLNLEVGDTLSIPLNDGGKSYPLKISVNRRESVNIPAGQFDCLVLQPFLESEGMFRSKGKIEVWFSDDQYKLPVVMRTYIMIIGHIDAKLAEYKLGK